MTCEHILVKGFAEMYGVHEGLLLSEMCRMSYYSGARERAFSIEDLAKYFNYLSGRQIRYAVKKLEEKGGVLAARGDGFTRTARYCVSGAVYRQYCGAGRR